MLDRERADDIALEALNATASHLRRIVTLGSTAFWQVSQEVVDLARYYRELAAELRHSKDLSPPNRRGQ
jgi:hypothetical protein